MKKHLIGAAGIAAVMALLSCVPPQTGSPDPSSPAAPGNAFFVFVDITNGTNGAAGTREDPVDDIPEGLTIADAAGKAVCVAAGTYAVDSNSGSEITLIEGVSLYGGYSADGNWTRNIAVYETIITDLAASASLTRAIWCPAGVTAATVVDGFTVNAGTGSGATAVLSQGDCTLSRNSINGFQGAPDALTTSYAVFIPGASPILLNNTLNGGNHSSSYGVYMYGFSSPVISGNAINGGGGDDYSVAIYSQQSSPQITDNALNSGSANLARGVYLSNQSEPDVEGNTFIDGGGAAAVAFSESADADEPTLFINNGFGSGFDINYLDYSGSTFHIVSDIAAINALDEDGRNPAGTVYGNYLLP